MSSSTVHKVAQAGFGTGTNELYDRSRPTYQPFSLDFIRESLNVTGPINIVEIGAGTGIFTRAILADEKWNSLIKELKAKEPSDGMRKVFSRTVLDDRISISEGYFHDTGVEDGWADLIVIAQAFHWCPDYDDAVTEFSRVLKPNGTLALIWNLEDRDSAEWVGKIRDTIEVFEQGTPQFRHGYWRQTFDTPSYKQNFEPHSEKVWQYHIPGTRESVVDRALSKSYIAVLPENQKKEVQDKIRSIVDLDKSKVWIDESEGIFEYPYKVYVVLTQKK